MDELLIQENKAVDSGLVLNDDANVKRDEKQESHLHQMNSLDAFIKPDEDTCDDGNNCGTSVKNDDESMKELCGKETSKEHFAFSRKLSESAFQKEESLGNERRSDDNEAMKQTKDEYVIFLKGNDIYDSESMRKSLTDNIGKLVDNIVEENQATAENITKDVKSAQPHIQYKTTVTKQPEGKVTNYRENQKLNRKPRSFSEDTECGFSIFRCQWLQPFATVKTFAIIHSILGLLHGSYYSYLIGTMSTLEKKYAFENKVSGVIMGIDEISPVLLGVLVGYYAGRANKPRLIALGMYLSAAAYFISSLPHFICGTAKNVDIENGRIHTGAEMCNPDPEKNSCNSEGQRATQPAVLLLALGSVLKGFGSMAYWTIGLTYLDDNSKKGSTPMYIGFVLALQLLGPFSGFLLSSVFLKFYENPTEEPGYGPDDPRWIGAWWIGFLLQGILLSVFTIPIAFFPKRLPGHWKVERKTSSGKNDDLKQNFFGLTSALKRLGTNPVFVLLVVNANVAIFGHYGPAIMVPKYMEHQFRLTASEASLYSGAISVAFMVLATILGGYLIWKFKPTVKTLLGGMIASEIIFCSGLLVLIIPRCQTVDLMNFGVNKEGLILNSACNQMCDCSTTSYAPVCGPGNTTYFSPCHAGCFQEVTFWGSSKKPKEFGNCSCVFTQEEQYAISPIFEGVCPDDTCWSQAVVYLATYFVILTISTACTVAHTMILLRSVHPRDKSIALGTFEAFACLFGFIPFPIAFGALVDSACLVWEKTCDDTGNCWFYDMERYSYLLHGVSAMFCFFSTLCLTGIYVLSPKVRDLYLDDEEEKEYVDIQLYTASESAP